MTQMWDGKGTPLDFVVSKNLQRRHLNDTQRGVVAGKIASLSHGGSRGNQYVSAKPPIGGLANATAAKLMNVSERSVARAKAVLDRGVPEGRGPRAAPGYGRLRRSVHGVCTGDKMAST